MNVPRQPELLEPLQLTTFLIRHFRIHQGLWTLQVVFRTSGHNFVAAGDTAAFPSVVASVVGIGLRPVEVADELTVDAAAVNPARARP